ncbi:MAG: hypothetical protein HY875_16360 [Chloroflexi bacterium]|nr:hypothetical protein [Chloroflexota bacterium]
MKYRILWAAAFTGIVVHVIGLAWDVYLHSDDATLAAREGVFTLSNPGHALIVAGIALTASAVLGMATAWMHDRRLGGEGFFAAALRAGTLPVMGLAVGAAIFVATGAERDNHDHQVLEASGAHSDDTVAVVAGTGGPPAATGDASHPHPDAASATGDAMAEGNAHTHGTEVPVTPEQLAAAAAFYARVETSAAKFEDIRVAMASGYIQITQDLEGIAAHFANLKYNSDGNLLDPERPEILLYSKRLDGTWKLLGFMFTSEKVTELPPSFFGPLDAWHRHENLCFTANAVSVKPDAASCRGVFSKTTAWNLHVWTAPGASGVFAHDFPPISPGAFPGATLPATQDLALRTP